MKWYKEERIFSSKESILNGPLKLSARQHILNPQSILTATNKASPLSITSSIFSVIPPFSDLDSPGLWSYSQQITFPFMLLMGPSGGMMPHSTSLPPTYCNPASGHVLWGSQWSQQWLHLTLEFWRTGNMGKMALNFWPASLHFPSTEVTALTPHRVDEML